MRTQDALNLLIALEERVARVYPQFFRSIRVESMRTELPEGAARPFVETDVQCQRLVGAAKKVPDTTLRLRLETMLGSAKGR